MVGVYYYLFIAIVAVVVIDAADNGEIDLSFLPTGCSDGNCSSGSKPSMW